MARSASPASVISTNAKPRDRPVSRSVIKLTRSTAPYASKAERMDSSVAPKSKFPTKSFFMVSPTFEGELDGGRRNSRPNAAGQPNAFFIIAGYPGTGFQQ